MSDVSAADERVIGVAVIGLGFMGRVHLAEYARAPRVAVRAAFDPANPTASSGNLITTSDDTERLLAATPRESSLTALLARSDVELVSICTPTDTHIDLARAAISAGKHVLLEKPVSLDAQAIDALEAHARAAGVLVMPAHCMRFWPAWSWMADAVREKKFGAVRRASFRRLGAAPNWSQKFYLDDTRSGGAMVDLHIHDADFVRFVWGEPRSVSAQGSRRHVHTTYEFADGLSVHAEGGWMNDANFAFTMVASIECENGIIDFRLGREVELMVLEVDGAQRGVARAIIAGVDYATGTGYEHEIAAFLAAIRANARCAPVTLADAAATQRLLDREFAAISDV